MKELLQMNFNWKSGIAPSQQQRVKELHSEIMDAMMMEIMWIVKMIKT